MQSNMSWAVRPEGPNWLRLLSAMTLRRQWRSSSSRSRYRRSAVRLRWERLGVVDTASHPNRKLLLGTHIVGGDAQPTLHGATAHLHWSGVRRCHEIVGALWVDSHHHSTLPARGDGHVAADHEPEPAEHLLLGDRFLRGQQLTDAIGQVLV